MARARTHRIGLFAPPQGAVSAAPIKEDEFVVVSNGDTLFSLSETYAASGVSILTVNGVRYAQGTDYNLAGTTLTWLDTPFTLQIGDCIVVAYEYVP